MATTATVRSKGQVTLPRDVRHALRVDEGDQVAFDVAEDGTVTIRGLTSVPADQVWFWTPAWQAGEREVDTELGAGRRGRVFHSDEEFLAALTEAVDDPTRL